VSTDESVTPKQQEMARRLLTAIRVSDEAVHALTPEQVAAAQRLGIHLDDLHMAGIRLALDIMMDLDQPRSSPPKEEPQ
jgi:hypothetical protein